MEGALVSAATGALSPVLEKLAALLGDEYRRFKGVRDQIRFLTSELGAMHAFLLQATDEEEDHDPQDKAWMAEVRELSYDMEDSIDEFMKSVDGTEGAKPDGVINKIRSSLGKMKMRRKMGKEMEGLKKQIVEVGERNARYRAGAVSRGFSTGATVDPRALAMFEDASRLVGIDRPRAELIRLLMEEDGSSTLQQPLKVKVKVVSIVGFGGMGKTTLANQVYQELKGQFECRAFISVSRTPDLMKLMRSILSEVTHQSYPSTEAGDVLQVISKIRDFLVDKRYLIVVDDIWNVEAWDIIRCAFPLTSAGSKIITTTRVKDVAHSCCSSFNGHVYNMRPLNMVHSRKLFHRRLFDSEDDCPSHLRDVSDEILKKCDGIPLALIAISGLLATRGCTKDEWDQVKNSIGHVLERNPSVDGMIKILSLSYFDLPPHLKTCLLYFSIFPEDHIIDKKGLIRKWIAEGFISREGKYTLYELGERCFNELLNRNLIQHRDRSKYDTVITCQVHDIVLDFIISKSIEENFVTLFGVPNPLSGPKRKVRRISLQVEKQESSVPLNGSVLVLSHVRSLNVFWHSAEIPCLDRFHHLRVLDLERCLRLKNNHLVNIGRLFQLRYLNLKSTGVSELPDQIVYLHCLEMLDLRETKVVEVPGSIVKLTKLVHLLVDDKVAFPDGIAKMQALEVLKRVGVSQQSLNFLQELGHLKNLRKLALDLRNDPATSDANGVRKEGMKAIMSSLDNLRSLTINRDDNFLLETCSPPRSLEKLSVYQPAIPRVPNFVGSLVNLQVVCLCLAKIRQEDLRILGGLPALLKLWLVRKCEDRPGIRVTVSGEDGFPCLRMFGYEIMSYAMDLMFAAGSMPKLEKLYTEFNTYSTEALTGGDFTFGIENLLCLSRIECDVVGTRKTAEAAKAAMEMVVKTHPNHPSLSFQKTTRG